MEYFQQKDNVIVCTVQSLHDDDRPESNLKRTNSTPLMFSAKVVKIAIPDYF